MVRSPVTILGDPSQSGVYLLRIQVLRDISLAFGRFKGGKPLPVPAGEYLYIGSAQAAMGSASLGPRLLRHATRTTGLPPHAIRPILLTQFRGAGLGTLELQPPRQKRLHWHIDHLLDQMDVRLSHVLLLRGVWGVERQLGQLLERDAGTVVIEKGLGAGDTPGNTHLVRVAAGENWWGALPGRLGGLIHNKRNAQTSGGESEN